MISACEAEEAQLPVGGSWTDTQIPGGLLMCLDESKSQLRPREGAGHRSYLSHTNPKTHAFLWFSAYTSLSVVQVQQIIGDLRCLFIPVNQIILTD